MPRLKSRVIIFALASTGFFLYNVFVNGTEGVLQFGQFVLTMLVLWGIVWQLFLKDNQLFRNVRSVMFTITDDDVEKKVGKKSRVVYE